ncbi:MAG: hypothetical protein ABR956_09920 [Terracidiphilus sp.]|jgi:hypothetical protein
MRKMLAMLLLVLPMGLCGAQSSTPSKPVEPTAIGVIFHLDPTTQTLNPLPDEHQTQVMKSCGVGGACSAIEVSGKGSAFRLKTDDKLEFHFNTGSPEKVSLFRFELKKNNRRLVLEKLARPKFGTGFTTEEFRGLPVVVSKFGTSSYQLVPASPLTPGEYAILIAGEVFTFGVDQ